MGDILIRGMEMPTSCDSCRIMMLEDTNCAPELYCGCPIVFRANPQGIGHRPDYCPLIPTTDVVSRECFDKLLAENDELRKVRPVVKAHWYWDEDGMDWGIGSWRCSACHSRPETWWQGDRTNPRNKSGHYFCPNCGARMEES